jgi:hypothetical protein
MHVDLIEMHVFMRSSDIDTMKRTWRMDGGTEMMNGTVGRETGALIMSHQNCNGSDRGQR